MTAPDRLLLIEGYLPNDIRWMESRLGEGEEYIRKGAFPVEEIREACRGPVYDGELSDLLERILSLLEDSE